MEHSQTQLTDDTFKNAVKEYVQLHDQIIEASRSMKDIKKRKEALGDAVLEYMRTKDIDELQMVDGKLMRKQSKKTESLKKEHIINELKRVDPSTAENIFINICSQRQVETKDSLKRTKARKP